MLLFHVHIEALHNNDYCISKEFLTISIQFF